ncbi:MAG: hypothetical protein PHO80_04170 [Candidatus Gracilibacteria bacterium]|nr:hypothetical protein [Candidatus Gracilibacteria bacterium]
MKQVIFNKIKKHNYEILCNGELIGYLFSKITFNIEAILLRILCDGEFIGFLNDNYKSQAIMAENYNNLDDDKSFPNNETNTKYLLNFIYCPQFCFYTDHKYTRYYINQFLTNSEEEFFYKIIMKDENSFQAKLFNSPISYNYTPHNSLYNGNSPQDINSEENFDRIQDINSGINEILYWNENYKDEISVFKNGVIYDEKVEFYDYEDGVISAYLENEIDAYTMEDY